MSKRTEALANVLLASRVQGQARAKLNESADLSVVDDDLEIVNEKGDELGFSIQLCRGGRLGDSYAVNMYAGEYDDKFKSRGDFFVSDVYMGQNITDAVDALVNKMREVGVVAA